MSDVLLSSKKVPFALVLGAVISLAGCFNQGASNMAPNSAPVGNSQSSAPSTNNSAPPVSQPNLGQPATTSQAIGAANVLNSTPDQALTAADTNTLQNSGALTGDDATAISPLVGN